MIVCVVDSSVIVKWLSQQQEERLEQADELLRQAEIVGGQLYTSQLADYEIGNALLLKKKLTPAQANKAWQVYEGLPVERLAQTQDRAKLSYKLGHKYGLTFYDAVFAALAYEKACPLVSDNPKHQSRVKEVEVIALKGFSKNGSN